LVSQTASKKNIGGLKRLKKEVTDISLTEGPGRDQVDWPRTPETERKSERMKKNRYWKVCKEIREKLGKLISVGE